MTKRRVMMYIWEKVGREYVQVEAGEGTFVGFGTDFEKVRDGSFSVTSAIVEMPDGRVQNYPLFLIRFLEEEEKKRQKRRVMTFREEWDVHKYKYVQVEAGEGTFVGFGTDFEETRDGGICHYTSAIVEMPDGRVRSMPLHMIRFLDVEDK